MKKIVFGLTLVIVSAFLAVGCAPATSTPAATPTKAAAVTTPTVAAAVATPTKAAASPVASPATSASPSTGAAGDVAAGQAVYDAKCKMCHASQSPNKAAGATAATLSSKVVTGTGHAGGKVDLTSTEVNNLAAYLATVK